MSLQAAVLACCDKHQVPQKRSFAALVMRRCTSSVRSKLHMAVLYTAATHLYSLLLLLLCTFLLLLR
jgi:hypothetical protein